MNEDFLKNPRAVDVLNKPRFGSFPMMGGQVIESDQDRITRLARQTFNHQVRVGELPPDAVFVPPVFAVVQPAPAMPAPVPVVQIVNPTMTQPLKLAPAADPSAPPAPGAPGTVTIPAPLKSEGKPAESPAIASLQAVPVKMPGDDSTTQPATGVVVGSVPADAPSTTAQPPAGKRAPETPQPPAAK